MTTTREFHFRPQERAVLFVGLDCATYWIVQKLVAEGRMPHLGALMRRGATFHTECEEPVVSPVVWTSIATAKTPDKHGVKSFHATSASVRTKRIWDLYAERGARVGVMGHFVLWPPQKLDGFVVPDLLALDDQTHPEDLRFLRKLTEAQKSDKEQGLRENLRFAKEALLHGVRLSTLVAAVGEMLRRKVLRRPLIEQQFALRVLKQRLYADVFIWLHRRFRPQYAYFHNHLIDTCSHIFWKYFEPEKFGDVSEAEARRYGDHLFQAYEEADRTLGRILQLADQDTLVVVASDHGAKAAVEQAKQWRIPTIKSERLMQALNLEKEVSYSNVGFDILVKPRVESPEKKERLKRIFQAIELVEDGVPLFQILEQDASNLWLRLNNAIDEINGRHIRLNGHVFELREFVHATNDRTSGVHDGKNAILVLAGQGVKPGYTHNRRVHVMDIVPTILALSAMPVGRDMDGAVLTDAIEAEFLKTFPVQEIDSYDHSDTPTEAEADVETSEALKSHLRALGYL